ncbi:MAG: fused MFS/spermidine synthase [Terriglobales bacterium]
MGVGVGLWAAIFFLSFLLVVLRFRRRNEPIPWLQILFFCSGFPALIYQIVWQRALFGIYGVNIESVTIVVSAFMLGLGLGSLAGGALTRRNKTPLLTLFAMAELGTAAFGLVSLRIFHSVAEYTAGSPPLRTGLLSFGLVVIPTVLMGATLPLLVEHMVRSSRNVGRAVGSLYFANTLGSAVACFVAGSVLMRVFGQSGSVRVAATINALIGVTVLIYSLSSPRKSNSSRYTPSEKTGDPKEVAAPAGDLAGLLPFPLALACAGFAGFMALAYEIVWYRILAFASGGIAPVFAFLLGSYLIGIALGSRWLEGYAQRDKQNRVQALKLLGWIFLASSFVSFTVGPLFAYVLRFCSALMGGGEIFPSYLLFLPMIGLGAVLFGVTFPLVSHVSIPVDDKAGASLSYLYVTNILGSTLGSFAIGFILMNYLSLWQISSILLVAGVVFAASVLLASGTPRRQLRGALALGLVATSLCIAVSRPVFRTIYDRLLFKGEYPRLHFARVAETRSGAVGETPNGTVYGGGVYDGRYNVDLVRDENMILRAYAISALHPSPRQVLMIGLGSGSWAQAIIANPKVEELTVIEINPAYLQLIPEHPEVASLLNSHKANIVIDDGRRWLLRNRGTKFDAIVMNSSFYWRDHSTNLLSSDFLRMVRQHLNPGGLFLYNTTGSKEVVATGMAVFPFTMRVENALVVSDSPLSFDRERWKSSLLCFKLDGKPLINQSDPSQMDGLDHVLRIPDDPTGKQSVSIEQNDELRRRLHGLRIITDDNMGAEWGG